jgi:predicted HTH domain antitoxin
MNSVTIEIPGSFASSFGATDEEAVRNAKIELAIEMYREGRWGARKAGEFAGMNRWQFMDVLIARKVPMPYTFEMLEQDIAHARSRV